MVTCPFSSLVDWTWWTSHLWVSCWFFFILLTQNVFCITSNTPNCRRICTCISSYRKWSSPSPPPLLPSSFSPSNFHLCQNGVFTSWTLTTPSQFVPPSFLPHEVFYPCEIFLTYKPLNFCLAFLPLLTWSSMKAEATGILFSQPSQTCRRRFPCPL